MSSIDEQIEELENLLRLGGIDRVQRARIEQSILELTKEKEKLIQEKTPRKRSTKK